jgi:pimeloyl-ACP methyl ester carboxylesterase
MKRWIALAIALLTLLAACGEDGADEPTTTGAISTTAPGATSTDGITVAPMGRQGVTFSTADGLTLEGTLYPAGSTWVLLAHMYPADMTSWFDFAAAAQEAGYTALAYNNRGYGASDAGTPLDVGADALAAFAYARANGAQAVFFFGASMNGAAALFLAAEEELAGLVTLSGVPAWDNTPGIDRAPEVTAPALFVAAEDDGDAVATAQAMADAVAGEARVVAYPTGGHGTEMFGDNPGLTGLLLEFVAAHS